MPTGYTADIPKGITFEQFALRCARGMGALILMRDDPWDAPIPDVFEVPDYYVTALAEKKEKRDAFMALSPEELEATYLAHVEKVREENAKRQKEADEILTAYRVMLAQVRGWVPPTADHHGMKKFMTEQIESSIDFDCRAYIEDVPATMEEWQNKRSEELHRAVNYAAKSLAEQTKNAASRTAWVQALKQSLEAK